jgi:hypothetical protein
MQFVVYGLIEKISGVVYLTTTDGRTKKQRTLPEGFSRDTDVEPEANFSNDHGTKEKNSSMKTLRFAVMASVLLIAAQARAGLVDYTISNPYVGTGNTSSGYADLETFNVRIDQTTISGAFAGGIEISQNIAEEGGHAVQGLPTQYTTLCTDISGTLYLGYTYSYATPVTPFNNQAGVDPTWGADNASTPPHAIDPASASAAIQNAAYVFYHYGGLTAGGITGSTEQMAALQLAVWAALYDTTSSGNVEFNSTSRFWVSGGSDPAAITEAASLLQGLDGSYSYKGFLLYPDPPNGGNNGIGQSDPPQELFIAVPEPSTIIAGALMLLPFGASTIRILRRNREAKL